MKINAFNYRRSLINKVKHVRYAPVHNTRLDLQVSQRIVGRHFCRQVPFAQGVEHDVFKASRERLEGLKIVS